MVNASASARLRQVSSPSYIAVGQNQDQSGSLDRSGGG